MAEPAFVCDSSDREQWLEARRHGIGASDAPSILGLEGAFSSPFEIAAVKLGLLPAETADPESELMSWGRYVEGPMIAKFADETKLEAKPSSRMFRCTETGFEWQQATPDGVVVEGGKVGGIECKLKVYGADEWERHGVPETVVCQVQHSLAVMGWEFYYVLGLLDGYRLRFKRIEPNRDLIGDVIRPAEREFWQRVQDGQLGDAGTPRASATKFALGRLYPEDSGETVRLPGDFWLQKVARWQAAKADAKSAEKAALLIENEIKAAMRSATFAELDDGTVLTLKTTRRGAYAVNPTSFRTLRLKA